MKLEADKPEQFAVAIRSGVAHVERNLAFGADSVRLNVAVKMTNDMTIKDLHRLSIETAVQHLQGLLVKLDTPQA